MVPRAVKQAFTGRDRNKHEIALALAHQFSTLASKPPPKRKIWQSEDYRMSMFGGVRRRLFLPKTNWPSAACCG
jgi:hypothetical protein